MGYKPLMSGAPTIEITHARYEELVRAELQAVQYRNWLTNYVESRPEGNTEVVLYSRDVADIIRTIEGIDIDIEGNTEVVLYSKDVADTIRTIAGIETDNEGNLKWKEDSDGRRQQL